MAAPPEGRSPPSLDEVVEAYQSTGLRPGLGAWIDAEGRVCSLGAVACAQDPDLRKQALGEDRLVGSHLLTLWWRFTADVSEDKLDSFLVALDDVAPSQETPAPDLEAYQLGQRIRAGLLERGLVRVGTTG